MIVRTEYKRCLTSVIVRELVFPSSSFEVSVGREECFVVHMHLGDGVYQSMLPGREEMSTHPLIAY